MSNLTADLKSLMLIPVEPQPDYIESSGRWHWPLPERALFPGCCTSVVTASREWWEYAPSEAKPHPFAEGVQLRDDRWYWAVPAEGDSIRLRQRIRALQYKCCGLEAPCNGCRALLEIANG